MRKKLLGIVALVALIGAAPASADVIEFEFEYEGGVVASGSFGFANGATGILGYDDLTSFVLDIVHTGNTYTLAGIAGFNDYRHFAYDTAAGMFVESGSLCGFSGCGFFANLAAINSDGSSGYFFTRIVDGQFRDYQDTSVVSFDDISYRVPAPGALALFGLGLFGLGLARRNRRSVA